MSCGTEPGHVVTGLGGDHLSGGLADPGNGLELFKLAGDRAGICSSIRVESPRIAAESQPSTPLGIEVCRTVIFLSPCGHQSSDEPAVTGLSVSVRYICCQRLDTVVTAAV
jgi:hypothetical protein